MNSVMCYPLRKVLAGNTTSAAYSTLATTTTIPSLTSAIGFIDVFDAKYGAATETDMPKFLQLIPFGSDAANETTAIRVIGWSVMPTAGSPNSNIYVPQILAEVAVTLSAVTATDFGADNFLADTLTLTYGEAAGTHIVSPQNDLPASFYVHLRGCRYITIEFNRGVSAATSNALWRFLEEI